ncbi:MAG: DNA-binding protein [Ketobacter sp.]|nr:DNA-binding protein [Planctomycetota bacterium]MCP5017321.1 DNA-binding protein [Ketobacter sp.]
MAKMHEYEFELIYRLNLGEDPEQHVEALYEAGCDDFTIGLGQRGSIALMFTREAKSALNAIRSAIKQVQKAIPHATVSELERVEPWLMNLSELAEEFGFTKQNMSRYQRGESNAGEFPHPYVAGRTSYWVVADVAVWMQSRDIVEVPKEKLEMYITAKSCNTVIQWFNRPKDMPEVEEMFNDFSMA